MSSQGTGRILDVPGKGCCQQDTAGCSLTPAVGEVPVLCCVVLAQPPQDQLVVHQSLDGFEQEGVEGQVANLLQLKLLINHLQLLEAFGRFLQFRQDLVVLLQVTGELLWNWTRSYLDQRKTSLS